MVALRIRRLLLPYVTESDELSMTASVAVSPQDDFHAVAQIVAKLNVLDMNSVIPSTSATSSRVPFMRLAHN